MPLARRMIGGAEPARSLRSVLCAASLVIAGAGLLDGCSATRPAPSGPSTPAGPSAPAVLSPPQAEVARQLSLAVDAARTLGPGHPLLISALYNSATFYHEQHRYAQAEALYRDLLQMQEARKGKRHPDVALTLERYATLLRDANRPEDAQRLEARAQRIRTAHEQQFTPRP